MLFQEQIKQLKSVNKDGVVICRLLVPVTGHQYANLATQLNYQAKKAGVKVLLLPYEVQPEEEKPEFPKPLSPGRWELSNGEVFQGKKAAAIEAENALKG